ncbi:hypothetical protein IMZ48_12035 [Candidatus Bathyarchaeota archaeon]|nr:hypothetical protein [Candidatus Bathyarchaeota archaeon]
MYRAFMEGYRGHGEGSTTSAQAPPAPGHDTHEDSPPDYDPLPAYSPTVPGSTTAPAALADAKETEKKAPVEDITSAFSSLHLTDEPLNLPNAETCLAHLKLLYAFRGLRDEVGYTDGLWGIADPGEDSKAPEVPLKTLSMLREKRWAVYLARAVDRYEAWWASLGGKEITLGGMLVRGSVDYEMFPLENVGASMAEETMMMPLGERVWTLSCKSLPLADFRQTSSWSGTPTCSTRAPTSRTASAPATVRSGTAASPGAP